MSTKLLVHAAPASQKAKVNRLLAEFGVSATWLPQPLLRGHFQLSIELAITASQRAWLASELATVQNIRFEIEYLPLSGELGECYLFAPGLGITRRVIDELGTFLIAANRLEQLLSKISDDVIAGPREIRKLLGQAIDDELEPFRKANESLTLLHRAG